VFGLVFAPGIANAANCSLNTQSVFFGEYDYSVPLPVNATGLIWLQCDANTPVRVSLDAGLYSGGNPLARQMESGAGGAPLRYNIYTDSSYSQVWGDGSRGTGVYSTSVAAPSTNVILYGRIPPFQNVPTGIYQDSLTITMEW
jgi:spore coat protein U-like protein